MKDGYGRNFLLPQGKAIRWTRGTEKQIDGITVLSIAPLISAAVKEVFEDGSVTSLFGGRA